MARAADVSVELRALEGTLSILCYHTVDPNFRSRLSLSPQQFREHCRWLASDRDVVDLSTALDLVDRHGRLPAGTVALTFDDGLGGVYRHAYPVLVEYGLPATVFMVTDTLTGAHDRVDWVDGAAPGTLDVMSVDEMLEMRADGLAFGSHSSRHLLLTGLSGEECVEDLARSRRVLQEILGETPQVLAYPRGVHDAGVRRAAEAAGFTHALSLPERPEFKGNLAVPRVGVYAHNSLPVVRLKSTRPFIRMRTSRAYRAGRAIARGVRTRVASR